MDLVYDSSLPLPDLADCLDTATQSGPGEVTVGPQQDQSPAGGETRLPCPQAPGRLEGALGDLERLLGCHGDPVCVV